jgi:hypothetical protein
MTVPVVNVNSYSHLIRLSLLERMKLVPPFDTVAAYGRSKARIIQAEHIPFLGVYFLGDTLSSDGDANHAEPRFDVELKLGFSYIVQNNDPELAEDFLDAAYWSFMTMLHDPEWHRFPDGIRIESVTGGIRQPTNYGNIGNNPNETPIAELPMEMTYFYRIYFEPIPTDLFESIHVISQAVPTDLGRRQSIVAKWAIEQTKKGNLRAVENRDTCLITAT